jgi:membrane protein
LKATKGMRWPGKGMGWKEFFVGLKNEWNGDALSDVAGNVTYQGILAFFPFLLFLVALGGLFINPQNAQQLIQSLGRVAPAAVTQILADRLKSIQESNHVSVLTTSAVFAFWSASGGVTALMRALNTVYGVKEGRPFWKVRGIAVIATAFAVVTSLLAALAAIAAPAVAHFVGGPAGTLILWLRLPVAALLVTFLWAVLFYILPDVEQDFRFITPGSIVGVVIWLLASVGFSVYVNNFGKYEATYGALAGVVVLLLWIWISAQAFLLGAEINAVIEHKSPGGKKVGAKSLADKGADGTKTEKAHSHVKAHPKPWLDAQDAELPVHKPLWASVRPFEKIKNRLWIVGAFVACLFHRQRGVS